MWTVELSVAIGLSSAGKYREVKSFSMVDTDCPLSIEGEDLETLSMM
jgi:hypothetical protein